MPWRFTACFFPRKKAVLQRMERLRNGEEETTTHTQGWCNFWNKSVKDIKHGGRRKTLVAEEGMFIQPSLPH